MRRSLDQLRTQRAVLCTSVRFTFLASGTAAGFAMLAVQESFQAAGQKLIQVQNRVVNMLPAPSWSSCSRPAAEPCAAGYVVYHRDCSRKGHIPPLPCACTCVPWNATGSPPSAFLLNGMVPCTGLPQRPQRLARPGALSQLEPLGAASTLQGRAWADALLQHSSAPAQRRGGPLRSCAAAPEASAPVISATPGASRAQRALGVAVMISAHRSGCSCTSDDAASGERRDC